MTFVFPLQTNAILPTTKHDCHLCEILIHGGSSVCRHRIQTAHTAAAIGTSAPPSACICAGEVLFLPNPPSITGRYHTVCNADTRHPPENAPPQCRCMLSDYGMLSSRCSSCTNIRANAPSNRDQVK
ncbi:hypothetical protein BASA_1583 [Bifidobacterium animalis subsp. animalis]|nr:hypothetical protein BASA_1583 [Bifidobacterium animalis subsp. animalis]